MKKFILSLVAFFVGAFGFVFLVVDGMTIKSTYTTTGVSDSLTLYEYTYENFIIVFLAIFFFMAVAGFVCAFKFARQKQV